jgi:hypothetical protein
VELTVFFEPSENPTMRYLAGKDVEKHMEAKRGMSGGVP